jgi:hypothetical protein
VAGANVRERSQRRGVSATTEPDAEPGQRLGSLELDADDEAAHLTTVNGYVGPGLNLARFSELNAVQLIATTPMDDGTARLWQCARRGR